MISQALNRWRAKVCWGEDATLLRFLDRALACESSRLLWQLEDYAAPEAGPTWSCSTLQSLDLRISRKTYWVQPRQFDLYIISLPHLISLMWFFPSNKPLVPSGDDVYTPNHLFPPDSGKSLGMVHLERGCLRRVRHPDWRRPTQGGDQLNILQLGLDVIGQLFLSMSLSTCFLKHHCDIADATAFLLLHLGETCKHQHFSVFFFFTSFWLHLTPSSKSRPSVCQSQDMASCNRCAWLSEVAMPDWHTETSRVEDCAT